jgi:O-acetyl-ADP-ribose deacetylase
MRELVAGSARIELVIGDIAGQHGIDAVVNAATGVFGFPADAAAAVALRTVAHAARGLVSVRTIRFVLYDERSLQVHERALDDVARVAEGPPRADLS